MNNNNDDPKTSLERLLGRDTNRNGEPRRDPSFGRFADHHEDDYEEPDRDTDFDTGYQSDSVDEEEIFDDEPLQDPATPPAYSATDTRFRYDDDPVDDDAEDDEDYEDEDPDAWLEEEDTIPAQESRGRQWPAALIVVAVVAIILLCAGGYGVMQQRAATEAELQQLRAALATSASPEEVRSSRGALQELQRAYDKLLADSEALALENRRLSDTVAGLEAQLGVQQSALSKTAAPAIKPATAPSASVTPAPQPAADRFTPLHSNPGARSPSAKPEPKSPEPEQTVPTPETSAPAATPTQAAPAKTRAEAAAPAPLATAPATQAPTPAPVKSSPGPWFVNFGSYATRNMAASWAAKLRPAAGEVIIAPIDSAGKTLYRLRIIGLADRDTAKAVARQLETELRVDPLWVGKE